jgi:hypothetical protein
MKTGSRARCCSRTNAMGRYVPKFYLMVCERLASVITHTLSPAAVI